MIRILVVDDSALMRKLLNEIFSSDHEFHVESARDGAEALEKLHSFKPNVITLDIQMPTMDGLACLDRIMIERPTPVVMISTLTADGAEETLEALSLGAVDFSPKPTGALSLEIEHMAEELIAKIRAASRIRVSKAARLSERLRARSRNLEVKTPVKRRLRRGVSQGNEDGLVVVGTSTGGPPALDKLLAPLPESFAWPILVAQHMPASFTGPLARRLDKICALTVLEVTNAQPLMPGTVYVGRGDADLIVTRRPSGLFGLSAPKNSEYRWHPSVDRLVYSALDHLDPKRIVGVLMTGMGDDGAEAMTKLHAAGGVTVAEDEDSAVVWGMPGSLVKNGGASVVAATSEIANHLVQLVGTR